MNWRPGQISDLGLLALTLLSLAFFVALERSKHPVPAPAYEKRLQAARLTLQAFQVLRQKREELGIPIDPVNDPNGTGLIGHAYSPITTTRGDLTAKLTSTNPNFAALFVAYFTELKLRPGDRIGVGWTGSFPALNVALLAACKVLDLEPVIVTSVGSSSWGANDPQFTWLDMEAALREAGLWDYRSVAASPGGADDVGRGLSPEGQRMLREAAERNGIPYFTESTLKASVDRRLALYQEHGPIRLYVNIGFGAASLGTEEVAQAVGFGLVRQASGPLLGYTVVTEMLKKRVPVVNMIHVNDLAHKVGLPIAPVPLPQPGEGPLFREIRYSVPLAWALALILGGLLYLFVRFDVAAYLIRKYREEKGDEHESL